MQRPNKIFFPLKFFFVAGLLFCLVGSFEVLAQEERGRMDSGFDHTMDHVTETGSSVPVASEATSLQTREPVESSAPQNEIKNEQLYRQGGEKEVRNEGLSTLSFNLFLYVADKFKENI